MEWWHETHRVSHDESQDSRGQRYAELHKKPSAKTRKVGAEGESLYLGKGLFAEGDAAANHGDGLGQFDYMLMNNPRYPHHTKIRIIGDTGHLSNKDSAYYLSEFIGPDTKQVVLAHLSEQNNTEELALSELKNELKHKKIDFDNICVAKQNVVSEVFMI